MTSASRMLPPGWITQVAPASTTTSRPSRNGKNASLAAAEPANDRPALVALIEAMRAESMRLIWPAPTPSVMPSRANTMVLLLTNLATRQANTRSSICCAVGCRRVTTFISAGWTAARSGVCTSRPPPTRLKSKSLLDWPAGSTSSRTFCLAANTARAASSNAGAITTSTNCCATACAQPPSTGRLKAMMPPKAEVGSVWNAFA